MRTKEDRQTRALQQLEELKPEILKLFLGAPDFGITSLKIHFMDGAVKRIIRKYEESVVPAGNEGDNGSRTGGMK